MIATVCALVTFVCVARAVVAFPSGVRASRRVWRLRRERVPAALRVLAPPGWFEHLVGPLVLPWRAETVWQSWVGVVLVVCAAAFVTTGPVGAVLAALGAGVVSILAVRWRRVALAALIDRQLVDVLDTMGASLRAGVTLIRSLDDARSRASGRLASDLGRVVASVEAGTPFSHALAHWSAACSRPSVRVTATALVVAADAGGAVSRTINGLAATLRDRLTLQRDARAMAAQARASVGVLVAAPVVFATFTSALDRGTVAFLFGSPVGLGCLLAGLALDAAGAWWMVRLTRGVAL